MNFEDKNIDELLISYLLKELEITQHKEVELWISASDENKSRFHEIEKLWAHALPSDLYFDSSKAWDKIASKVTENPENKASDEPSENIRFLSLKPLLSVAAVILMLLGSYFVFIHLDRTPEPTFLYANTKFDNDTLTDGSIIKLNANSTITYADNFNEDNREIKLEGEAFFDIKRDTSKAFIINIENSRVEVLGTSFNINTELDSHMVSVNVRSGLVKFSYLTQDTLKAYQSIQLRAGQKVLYNKNTKALTLSNDSLQNALEYYWVDKQLVFDGIRLEKVMALLEVVYDVKIKFSDEALKDCLLTVAFENEELSQIMAVIASTFNFEVQVDGRQYLLKGGSCENL